MFKVNIDKYGLKSWHGLVYSITTIIITFLMMVGTILSWARSTSEWFICTLTWVLLPSLILIVAFSVIGCSAASIVLVMNSGKSERPYRYNWKRSDLRYLTLNTCTTYSSPNRCEQISALVKASMGLGVLLVIFYPFT